jgi:hypothetical protein
MKPIRLWVDRSMNNELRAKRTVTHLPPSPPFRRPAIHSSSHDRRLIGRKKMEMALTFNDVDPPIDAKSFVRVRNG